MRLWSDYEIFRMNFEQKNKTILPKHQINTVVQLNALGKSPSADKLPQAQFVSSSSLILNLQNYYDQSNLSFIVSILTDQKD